MFWEYFLIFCAFFPPLFSLGRMYMPFYPMIGPIPIPIGCILTALIAWGVWGIAWHQLGAAIIHGIWFAVEFAFLYFTVALLLRALMRAGVLRALADYASSFSDDARIQVLMIAWLGVCALQGFIGFGASGAIAAIVLVHIGFSPLTSACMGLLGSLTCSSFSLMGMPIEMGIKVAMEDPILLEKMGSLSHSLHTICQQIALFHGIIGSLVPCVMVLMLTHRDGKLSFTREGVAALPFAFFAGVAFTVPFILTTFYFDYRWACLIGASIGFLLIRLVCRTGFLVPQEVWPLPKREEVQSQILVKQLIRESDESLSPLQMALPFILLLTCWSLIYFGDLFDVLPSWKNIGGSSLHIHLTVFPALIFLVVTWVCHAFYPKIYRVSYRDAMTVSFWMLQYAPFMCIMASIYFATSVNASHIPSMGAIMGQTLAQIPGNEWWGVFITPLLGSIFAYYSGNHIFADFMLTPFAYSMGQGLKDWGILFISLQAIGASACTLFSMNYLSGISEPIGRQGLESQVMGRISPLVFAYILLVSALGLFFMQAGIFDI